jgi:hypothetical protein
MITKQRYFPVFFSIVSLLLLAAPSPGAAAPGGGRVDCPLPVEEFDADPEATSRFFEGRCTWDSSGANPFWSLRPGYQLVLESDEEILFITVLDETRVVAGVRTRVVEEFEYEKDGDERIPVERSLNYYAICRQTNSVFYFGEDVEFFDEDGNVTSTEGTWLAGRNGARPGIVMPGTILVGGEYYEEIAPEDEALDKGEILEMLCGCEAGGKQFSRPCVAIAGSNDCNSDNDEKLYVKGIGIVVDGDLEIKSWGFVDEDDD